MAKGKADKQTTAADKEQRTADVDIEDVDNQAEAGAEEQEAARTATGMKAHVDSTRDAIMKKSRRQRKRKMKEDTAGLDELGKRQQEAMEAEVRGETHEFDADFNEIEPDEAPDDTPPADTAAETVDTTDDLVTIKVDGVEQTVSKDAVQKAGIAAMQKLATGDKRLKEVAEYEASVRKLEASLQTQIDELRTGQAAAEGSTVADEGSSPPTGDSDANIKEQVARVAEAIYAGDQDQVTENLTAVLTSALGRHGSTPTLDAKKLAQDVMDTMRHEAEEQQAAQEAEGRAAVAHTVNSMFQTEYKELYEDEHGFRLTKAEFDYLCEQNPAADRVGLMREAAGTVDQLLNPGKTADPLAQRTARKRAAAATATSSAQRAPTDPPVKRKTRSDTVRAMQKQRGQVIGQ